MKDKWIKVSDRLPEFAGKVLVLHKDRDIFLAEIGYSYGVWFGVDCSIPVKNTTHWMPIELPNED